jgi:methionyl-tRNA synthetase
MTIKGGNMPEKFYITTAIDYVNSNPHCGHAYEKICADVIARWHRLRGENVFFLTGTDENAQKNVEAAKERGFKDVKAFIDKMVHNFLNLCKVLNISYDDFIRTTEERHIKVAQYIFRKMQENGDIYKGEYEGLYCYGCEAFYTEKELKDGKCPIHEKKLEKIKEESYFFRLSKYEKQLLQHFKNNPDFVQPKGKYEEMVNRIKEGLKDLSVSRYKVEWGIPVLGDPNHREYVWKEALENYISALGYPDGKLFKKFWPADYHIIGADINFFHSVIWPAILMSINVEPPKHVFVHGFINIGGKKMSKSRGMVVDPIKLAKNYGADQLRYFLVREIPFGEDGDFSEDALKARINGELVSDLGNLVNRVLTLAEKSGLETFEGRVELDKKLDFRKIEQYMDNLELHHGIDEIFNFIRSANRYINEKEPWKLSGKELEEVLYNLLESLRVIAILIYPFMPGTAEKLCQQLGVELGSFKDLKFGRFKGKPKKGELLFEKVL